MSRIFVAVLLILLQAGHARSQSSFGIHAGAILSKPQGKVYDASLQVGMDIVGRTSYSGGLMADIPFGESALRLFPELNFSVKDYRASTQFGQQQQSQLRVSVLSRMNYMEMPLNLAFALPVGKSHLILGAGPYLGLGLSGKSYWTINDLAMTDPEDIVFGNAAGEYKPLDYGVNVLLGFVTGSGLMVKANYSMGQAELSNLPQASFKHRQIGVSLGYFFLRSMQ